MSRIDPDKPPVYNLRGVIREAYRCKAREVVLAGPSDCGKTVGYCLKAHNICMKYPGAQGAIVRKVYASMRSSVIQTFNRIIANRGVNLLGGEVSPQLYIYPNGSRIWVGGMDKPEKVLSSERDFVYVNQAEQLELNDWELLATRTSGRAAVVPFPQLLGDANPGGRHHWIKQRAETGSLQLFSAHHIDNPTIYNEDGTFVNEKAKLRIDVLMALSGIRRKRLFEGIWATAEGAVFDTFDDSVHVCTRDPKEMQRWFLCEDEGYTNPAAVLLVGADSDGRWHVFKEFYKSFQLQSTVVEQTKAWYTPNEELRAQGYGQVELCAVDEAAAGLIADLNDAGVYARGGKGRIQDGITRIQNRLKVAGDGKPRLTLDPDCKETINEFESHVWEKDKPKDVPKDCDNHAIAALRYLGHVLGEPTGAFTASNAGTAATGGGNPSMPPSRVFVPRSFTPRFTK